MKKTWKGSCHCKAVHFEAELDLSKGTGKCNCSWCAKSRGWGIISTPADFRLVVGEEDLSTYRFNTGMARHRFCRRCGIRMFTLGHLDVLGGDFVSINIATLDEIDDEELASLAVHYADGRNDNWQNAPAVVAHL